MIHLTSLEKSLLSRFDRQMLYKGKESTPKIILAKTRTIVEP